MAKQTPKTLTRLGRGLDELLPASREERVVTVRIDQLLPAKKQPRTFFDEERLCELAASLKEHGLIQPIVVRKEGTKYRIIAGERRYRAAKMAGLKELQAVVYKGEEDYLVALTENIQRQDLNPIEIADAYSELMKRRGLTQQQLAEQIGKSRPEISNYLRLLSLSDKVKRYLIAGEVTVGQVRPLATLPPEEQDHLVERIVAEGLTARQVEQLSRRAPRASQEKNNEFAALEQELLERIGIPVRIRRWPKKIVVSLEFVKMRDFQGFIDDLKKR